MLPEERQKYILQQLQEYRSVRIADLCEQLNVTRETIRRDIYELEEKGLAKKVHGGAILDKANVEAEYMKRRTINIEEKKAIARLAASFVEDGDALYIDLGSTTYFFAQAIKTKKNLTVITNSLPIAIELSSSPEIKVILPGGIIRNGELSLSGPISMKGLDEIYVDKAFIGVAGVAIKSGFTNIHLGEAEVTKKMLQNSQLKVVLADYAKFNTTTMVRVAKISDIDLLITDWKAPAEILTEIREHGVKVKVAEEKK